MFRKFLLVVVLLSVLVLPVSAAPPSGDGRYDLVLYAPPVFQVDVWLGEPNSATIYYNGTDFTVTTAFNQNLKAENMAVLSEAIDFALDVQYAMPVVKFDKK